MCRHICFGNMFSIDLCIIGIVHASFVYHFCPCVVFCTRVLLHLWYLGGCMQLVCFFFSEYVLQVKCTMYALIKLKFIVWFLWYKWKMNVKEYSLISLSLNSCNTCVCLYRQEAHYGR
jgi:hypothetical protein